VEALIQGRKKDVTLSLKGKDIKGEGEKKGGTNFGEDSSLGGYILNRLVKEAENDEGKVGD